MEVVVLEIDKANRRLSLGHKQLQENPWDVFETIFTVDSIHNGEVIEASDKGYVVKLEQDVEGFVPMKQAGKKEDGSAIAVGDKLDFRVIEFNKTTKRIVLAYGEGAPVADRGEKSAKGEKSGNDTQKTVKKINSSIEKTTLGDISELAELKAQLESKEK